MTTPELIALVKKNPVVSLCGVLAVALAAGIYFRSDAIPAASKNLDEKSALAQRYTINIANGAQLKEQLEALKNANKVIESRLIRASDIGINQQFFYKLESESGVKLVDLRQGRAASTKGDVTPIAFTVTLQGDFNAVLKFLRVLEDQSHYCRVQTVSCAGGRAGPVSLTLNLELLGRP